MLCMFLSPSTISGGIQYLLPKQSCSFENERLISFTYTIWLKKILHGVCFFTLVHECTKSLKETYNNFFQPLNYFYVGQWFSSISTPTILTEGGESFKTFLKENCPVALGNCYLLKFDSLLVCNIRFFAICLCGCKFLTSLDSYRLLESIAIN